MDLILFRCGRASRRGRRNADHEHLAHGEDTRTIAAHLVVSDHTVNDHVKAVLAKTGSTSRRTLLSTITGTT
ncbi:MAG: hypothetical protein NVS4B6_22980 [Mycobacterium sp.]